MGTKCNIWTTLSFILMTCMTLTECAFGDSCSYDDLCNKWNSIGYYSSGMRCKGGNCVCGNDYDITYGLETAVETCDSSSPAFALGCLLDNCPVNSACVNHMECRCNEGFVKVGGGACKRGHNVSLFHSCYVTSNAIFRCNSKEHSMCRSGTCICFDKYIPNYLTGKCEHQSSYLERHGLYEYRVKPGEYCKDDDHCISGLICTNFTCACPNYCFYESFKEVCDCGAVEFQVGPFILGTFVTCLIIVFWGWRIKITIQRFKYKKNIQRSTFSAVPHESPRNNSHNLNQIVTPSPNPSHNSNSRAEPQASLNVNAPLSDRRRSPRASPRLAERAEPYSINVRPISQAEASTGPLPYSDPPPPYSEVVNIAPPPYSLCPLPVSSSSPVHSENTVDPTNCNPMPNAPDTLCESATPIPLNTSPTPSPSVSPQATDNIPYPCSPIVAQSSPRHETGNNDVQPACDGSRF